MTEQLQENRAPLKKSEVAQEVARDASVAAVAALVGVALGGLPGAVAGATVSPFIKGILKLASDVVQRRRIRAEAILSSVIQERGISPEHVLDHLENHPADADAFISLINQAVQSDPSTDAIMAAAIGELFLSPEETKRERVLIVADALKGLRSTHMRILRKLQDSGGVRTASELAADIEIPEVELRGVVRELELRAMIKDVGKHPVEWKLRELGRALMSFDRPLS